MLDFFEAIFNAPIATLFIVAGLIFLGIAVVGKISGKVEPGRGGRIASGVLGTILLGVGLVMSGEGPIDSSRTSTPAMTVEARSSTPPDTVVLTADTPTPTLMEESEASDDNSDGLTNQRERDIGANPDDRETDDDGTLDDQEPNPRATVAPTVSSLYFTDARLSSGRIYKLENGEEVSTYYTRSGNIYYLAAAPDGTVYFSNANDFDLYKLESGAESLVFTHDTYLRDVEFDTQGRLYFSEATGAGGDGFIYRLDGSTATIFYRVRLSQVDGSWSGNFAFDNNDALWLSSGNRVPAHLYKVVDGAAQRVYTSQNEPVMGFFFEPNGNLLYTNHRDTIYRLTVPEYQRAEIYVYPSAEWLNDVAPVNP